MPKKSNLQKLSKNIQKQNQKLWWILIVGIVIITLVIGSTNPASTSLASDFVGFDLNFSSQKDDVNKLEKVFVKRVVDGDTIELGDGRKIRYLNIDTPETVKPNTPVECFGSEAKKLNQSLVENKTVYIIGDKQSKDRYDRYLRFVFLNQSDASSIDKSVNAYMIKYGFATTLFYSPNTTFKAQFIQFEKQAKANQLGLWKVC
jgi:endonuclease YncB( thermonuclease family)